MALEMAKIRAMSPEDLDREEAGLREEIWKLRLQRSVGQSGTPHKVQAVRHDLARILTCKHERAREGRQG
jgi:ribosomal protein L29